MSMIRVLGRVGITLSAFLVGLVVLADPATPAPAAAEKVNVTSTFRLVKVTTLRERSQWHTRIVRKVWRDAKGHKVWYRGAPAGRLETVLLTPEGTGVGEAQVAVTDNCCNGEWQEISNAGRPGNSFSFGFDVQTNDIHARGGSTEKIATRFGNGAVQDVVNTVAASAWSNDGQHNDDCTFGPLRCRKLVNFWSLTVYHGAGGSTVGWDPQSTTNPSGCSSMVFAVSAAGIGVSSVSPVCPDTFGPRSINDMTMGATWHANQGATPVGKVIGAGHAVHERFVRPSNGGDYTSRSLYLDVSWYPNI